MCSRPLAAGKHVLVPEADREQRGGRTPNARSRARRGPHLPRHRAVLPLPAAREGAGIDRGGRHRSARRSCASRPSSAGPTRRSRRSSTRRATSWRFNDESPGGHLFDDVMHKYAMALWLVDEDVRSVQAVVRQGPLFFEAPTVALWEYARQDLLGMMEVSYAPDMFIRSELLRRRRVLRDPGDARLRLGDAVVRQPARDLPPVVLYEEDGRRTSFAELDASYDGSFRRAAAHFVDALLAGADARAGSGHRDQGAPARVRRLPGVERAHAGRSGEHRRCGLAERLAARRRRSSSRTSRRWSRVRRREPSDSSRTRRLIAPIPPGITVVRRPGRAAAHHHAHVGWYPRTRLLTSGRACP